jgi:predicted branched-subunit amino acid permease
MDVYRVFSLVSMWGSPAWAELSEPGGAFYEPRAASLFRFELFGLSCLICLAFPALIGFLKKARSFPSWAVGLIISSIALNTIDVMWASSISNHVMERLRDSGRLNH